MMLQKLALTYQTCTYTNYVTLIQGFIHGSHRSPKVLNVIEFDFSIRVPSNVLELH